MGKLTTKSVSVIPSNRLILWTGIIVLPFAALASAVPAMLDTALVFIVIFVIVSVSDAIFSRRRISGLKISLPEVVRLSKGREGQINISIHNEECRIKHLRIGLMFPNGIHSPYFDMRLNMPETPSASILWQCKGIKKGRYLLERCFLETPSLIGLWAIRTEISIYSEIRVYHDLYGERHQFAALFLKKSLGIHSQRQIGKGRDFEQLRDYLPGDSFEDIHWKATAKYGRPITKVYQVERTQQIYALIDASRLSIRTSGQKKLDQPHETIFDRFVTGALLMGIAAERHGDMFGVLVFCDRVRAFIKAGSGKAHYDACRDTLYTIEPQSVTPDINELFAFIGTRIRRRSLLVFLTSMDDPAFAESFIRGINMISKKHIAIVNMIRPDAANPLFSAPDVKTVDDIYRKLGGHYLWESLRETEKKLRRYGVGFTLIDNEKVCTRLISQYLSIKQRQIL